MVSKVRIGQIGLGYWGPNLLRNMAKVSGVEIAAVADLDAARLEQITERQASKVTRDYKEILKDVTIDAILLSTPASTHYAIAKEALEAGKHVLVEKPLASSSKECEELTALAHKKKRTLMVGHTFLYSAAVQKLKDYIDQGELGDVYYLHSERLNLGRVRQDVNALWNFGPHDVSILLHLLGSMPVEAAAHGFSYLSSKKGIEDVAFVVLTFPKGVAANIHLSWLDPLKVRRMTVVGSKKMAVYDDVNSDSKIMLLDRKVEKIPTSSSPQDFHDFAEFQMRIRNGDVTIPYFSSPEPLYTECQHFIDCIRSMKTPLTGGEHGLKVVQILEACERSMKLKGAPQAIKN